MNELREEVKEQWGKFTKTNRPFLSMGMELWRVRQFRLYLQWGHENIQKYLTNELHMPIPIYNICIAAIRQAQRLNLSLEDFHIEKDWTVGVFVQHAKVSKTKDELSQRLNGGDYDQNPIQTRYKLGPFLMSIREMHSLWAAKKIIGDSTRKFEKDDLLNVVNYVIDQAKKEKL